jgi:fusion protein PurCD
MDSVLIVGGQAREHAIAVALDCRVDVCAQLENPGLSDQSTEYFTVDLTDVAAVRDIATELDPDVVVVGSEEQLAAGLVDELTAHGIPTFGPSQSLARLETDKIWQRRTSQSIDGVQQPNFSLFTSSHRVRDHVRTRSLPFVVRPPTLSAGRGVVVVESEGDRRSALRSIVEYGEGSILVEERVSGDEFSVFGVASAGRFRSVPPIRDYKRAHDGDRGPNTGGMGCHATGKANLQTVTDQAYREGVRCLQSVADEFPTYSGVLCGQFIERNGTIVLIDYNVRFGDPEVIPMVAGIQNSFEEIIERTAHGEDIPRLEYDDLATVAVCLAPRGYPDTSAAGNQLRLVDYVDATPARSLAGDRVSFLYGRVDNREKKIEITNSRVATVFARRETVQEASNAVYDRIQSLPEQLRCRCDVGQFNA